MPLEAQKGVVAAPDFSGTLAGAAPVFAGPTTATGGKDSVLALSGIGVSDPDDASGYMRINVSAGSLTMDFGPPFGRSSVTPGALMGASFSAMSNWLGTLQYTPPAGFEGVATVSIGIYDSSSLASETGRRDITVTVGAGSAPVNTVPVAAFSTYNDMPLALPGFSVDDVNGDALTSTLTVQHGTLTVAGGNVPGAVSGDGTATLELAGTAAQINSTLASLSYTPSSAYSGPDSLQIFTSDLVLTDTDAKTITVLQNTAPTHEVPFTTLSTDEDVSRGVPALRVEDAQGGTLTTTLVVAHGTLSVLGGNVGGVSGDGTNAMTITGTAAQINDKLASLAYAPDADYNGPDAIDVSTSDLNLTGTATVPIQVTAVGDIVEDVNLQVTKPASLTVNLLANDTFSATPVITAVSNFVGGNVTIGSGGEVTFTPDAGFTGPASFDYTVRSGGVDEAATAVVTVIGAPPVIVVPGTIQMDEDATVTLAGANAIALTDTDNDVHHVSFTFDPSLVSLSGPFDAFQSLGAVVKWTIFDTDQTSLEARLATVSITPVANFVGQFTVTVDATDINGQTDSADIAVTVDPAEDTPDTSITLVAGSPMVSLGVLDGVNISAATFGTTDYVAYTVGVSQGFQNPAHGTVAVNPATGYIELTLAPGFMGTETFTYTVDTPYGEHEDAVVTVNVTEFNDPPVITAPDAVRAAFGVVYAFDGVDLITVADPEGDVQSVELTVDNGALNVTTGIGTALISAGANGSATLTLTGDLVDIQATLDTLTYTQTGSHFPAATLSIVVNDAGSEVTDSVNIVVQRIVLDGPASVAMDEDSSFAFDLANAISVTDGVAHGNLQLSFDLIDQNGDGLSTNTLNVLGYISGTEAQMQAALASLVFTPPPDYYGDVVLRISALPEGENSGSPLQAIALINIEVRPVSDATNDTIHLLPGESRTFNFLTGDGGATADSFEDPQAQIIDVTSPANGTLTAGAAPGEYTFTPDPGFVGTTSFTYQVKSGYLRGTEFEQIAGLTETATVTFIVNTPPTQIVPAPLSTAEDTPLAVSGIGVDDTSHASVSTTVSVLHGTVSVTGVGGTVSNSGTASLTISGTLAQVNAQLSTLVYANTPDYNGADTLTVRTTDSVDAVTDTVAITVTAVQDAFSDTVGTPMDTPVNFNVFSANPTAADSFEDAAGRRVTSVTALSNPAAGTLDWNVNGNGDGAMRFTPGAMFSGQVTFSYTVTSGGVTEEALVTLTVSDAPNVAPTQTVPGPLTAVEDTPLSISTISVGDTDGNNVTTTLNVLHGTVSVGGSGGLVSNNGTASLTISGTLTQVNGRLASLTYTNAADYNGGDTLSVSTTDGADTVTDAVAITVTAFKDIQGDTINTASATPVTFNVFAANPTADSFEDAGRAITSVSGLSVAAGTLNTDVNGNGDGTMRFTPNAGFSGPVSFTYTVTSAAAHGGVSETATVTINVATGQTVAPTQEVPDTLTTPEDTPLAVSTISVADADSATVQTTVRVLHGTVSVGANGSGVTGSGTSFLVLSGSVASVNARLANLVYANTPDYNGADTLRITTTDGTNRATDTVAIAVSAVKDAFNDTLTTQEDAAVTVAATRLLANDSFEGSPVVTAVGSAVNGSVGLVAGNITFTPASGFNGQGSFTYTVTSGGVTETAKVTVNVNAVNDPTVVIAGTSGSHAEDGGAIANVLIATDADGLSDGTVYAVKTAAANGVASIDAATGAWSYTPNADYNGVDSFTVTITDDAGNTSTQLISLTVTPVVDIADDTLMTDEDTAVTVAATSLLANDSFEGSPVVTAVGSAVNGSVSLVAGNITFTPAPGFNGQGSFTYTVTSGGVTETATVTVTVKAVDDPTVITAGTSGTNFEDGGAITHTLVAVDADGLADGTVYAVATAASNGVASINAATGGWSYTPNADYNGVDSFTVTITDDAGNTSTQLITLTVTPVVDIADDTLMTDEDTALTVAAISLLATDSFEGSPVVTAVGGALNGSVSLVAGNITFTPAPGFSGQGGFTYTVTSGGVTETAMVAVTVNPAPNEAPTQNVPASLTALEDTPLAITTISVGDVNSTNVTTTVSVLHGTVSLGANRQDASGNGTNTLVISGSVASVNARLANLVYTNTADYNGADTLTVSTTDGIATTSSTLALLVEAVQDIAPDAIHTTASTPVTFNVFAANPVADSFEDAGRTVAYVTQLSNPDAGTLVSNLNGNGDGAMRFTPAAGFSGDVTLTYTVTSGGVTETAAVTITVAPALPQNHAPMQVVPGSLSATEDTSLVISNISVSDIDGDVLTSTLSVAHGTLTVEGGSTALAGVSGNGTGSLEITGTAAQINDKLATLRYSSRPDYNGADTLNVSTTDGAATDADAVAITIDAVADIAGDTMSTVAGQALTFNVLTGDGGAQADSFEDTGRTVTAHTNPSHGQLVVAADGTVSYQPDLGYSGIDSFSYTVSSGGVTETATVTVEVKPGGEGSPPPAPVAETQLMYTEVRSSRATVDAQVTSWENLTYIEPVVRASQLDAEMRVLGIDMASAPESGSSLFDAFGLSAPRTEFVSPLQQEIASSAGEKSVADAKPEAATTQAPAPAEGVKPPATAPRAAASFTSQLRRGSDALRTAGERATQRDQRTAPARPSGPR